MAERLLRGAPAAPGVAAGRAHLLAEPADDDAIVPPPERAAEADRAQRALELAAAELDSVAGGLREAGGAADAEIVDTAALMARDPALASGARMLVETHGRTASRALADAAEEHASAIAALGDPTLAARADDVRSVGRRAARLAAGGGAGAGSGVPDGTPFVVVGSDLGPADVAEVAGRAAGIALARGGTTAHAAIVARSLGVPMVVDAGVELLGVSAGEPLVLDGDEGLVAIAPDPARLEAARAAQERRARDRERAAELRWLPSVTADGRRVTVLANVASAAEADAALDAGAEGVGLLRTELAFLDAPAWPSEEQHRQALEPVLARLRGITATVRVLDFGGDKTPPFLRAAGERGIALLLAAPDALRAQLRAVLDAGRDAGLRVMLPMVSDPDEVRAVARLLAELGVPEDLPPLGAMIETPEAVERAAEIAAVADFLSIGTNDLTHSTLGSDRFAPGGAATHDPRVLDAIARTARAARAARIPLEVCGEAASSALAMPLLVGLGADELSAGAARVGEVREWVRRLHYETVRQLAEAMLQARDAATVEGLVRGAALLGEPGDADREAVQGGGSVVAVGPKA